MSDTYSQFIQGYGAADGKRSSLSAAIRQLLTPPKRQGSASGTYGYPQAAGQLYSHGVQQLEDTDFQLTETGKAAALFEALIRSVEVEGVVRAHLSAGHINYNPTFTVVVPSLFDEVTQVVFRLHGDVLRRFPTAQLAVHVEGTREQGIR